MREEEIGPGYGGMREAFVSARDLAGDKVGFFFFFSEEEERERGQFVVPSAPPHSLKKLWTTITRGESVGRRETEFLEFYFTFGVRIRLAP